MKDYQSDQSRKNFTDPVLIPLSASLNIYIKGLDQLTRRTEAAFKMITSHAVIHVQCNFLVGIFDLYKYIGEKDYRTSVNIPLAAAE